ncbi:hypothetical protein [Fibrobacter sp.]|uniref:hypothetical protein n=1 Tax=Fibrobacter sp. TaxID=35828 RepID=UPI00388E96CA
MRIFDVNNVEIESPDLEKGYLKEDSLFVMHHEATEAVDEEGHWEVIAEYPETGGQDVEWFVDVPAVVAKEAWDEYEDIYRYIEYTEEELAEIEAEKNKPTIEDRVTAIESQILAMEEAYSEGVASA